MPTKNVYIRTERYSHKKEAISQHKDPPRCFIQEILQNAFDAGNKVGVDHQIKMILELRDVTWVDGNARRKRVMCTIEDNCCGMDSNTIENGLLVVGADEENRSDDLAKRAGEAAGGFGQAKKLFMLAQDDAEVYTKKATGPVLKVERRDKHCPIEHMHIVPLAKKDTLDVPATFFSSGNDDSHGSVFRIWLNPKVMHLEEHIRLSRDYKSYCETVSNEKYYSKAKDYYKKFKEWAAANNLPIEFTIRLRNDRGIQEEATFMLDNDVVRTSQAVALGDGAGGAIKVKMGGVRRTVAKVFSKSRALAGNGKMQPKVPVVLEVSVPGKATDAADPYFLHCYEKTVTFQKGCSKEMQAVVLLKNRDEDGTAFRPAELLTGSRSNFSAPLSEAIDPELQKYLLDPGSKPPPKEYRDLNALGDAQPSGTAFASWYDGYSKLEREPKPYEWWLNMTKEEATASLGGKLWRDLPHKLHISKEEGVTWASLEAHFTNPEKLDALEMLKLEMYGAFVFQALECVGESTIFDIGYLLEGGIVVNFEGARKKPVENGGRPVYLMNPKAVTVPFPDEAADLCNLWPLVMQLRNLAHHEVAHTWYDEHTYGFYDKMTALRDNIEHYEQQSHAFTWFHIVKYLRIRCFHRMVQDGTLDAATRTKIVDQIFAMQAPNGRLVADNEGVRRTLASMSNVLRTSKLASTDGEEGDGSTAFDEDFASRNRKPLADLVNEAAEAAAAANEKVKSQDKLIKAADTKVEERDKMIAELQAQLAMAKEDKIVGDTGSPTTGTTGEDEKGGSGWWASWRSTKKGPPATMVELCDPEVEQELD